MIWPILEITYVPSLSLCREVLLRMGQKFYFFIANWCPAVRCFYIFAHDILWDRGKSSEWKKLLFSTKAPDICLFSLTLLVTIFPPRASSETRTFGFPPLLSVFLRTEEEVNGNIKTDWYSTLIYVWSQILVTIYTKIRTSESMEDNFLEDATFLNALCGPKNRNLSNFLVSERISCKRTE